MGRVNGKLISGLFAAHPRGVTEDEALDLASVYACMVLLKMGVSVVPGSHAEVSGDNGDRTASVTFTWKLAGELRVIP